MSFTHRSKQSNHKSSTIFIPFRWSSRNSTLTCGTPTHIIWVTSGRAMLTSWHSKYCMISSCLSTCWLTPLHFSTTSVHLTQTLATWCWSTSPQTVSFTKSRLICLSTASSHTLWATEYSSFRRGSETSVRSLWPVLDVLTSLSTSSQRNPIRSAFRGCEKYRMWRVPCSSWRKYVWYSVVSSSKKPSATGESNQNRARRKTSSSTLTPWGLSPSTSSPSPSAANSLLMSPWLKNSSQRKSSSPTEVGA